MKIRHVYYSIHFKKQLGKFEKKKRQRIKKKVELFLQNPLLSALKTHKLKGKLKDYWSFSVSYNIRILFEFIDEQSVGFIDIGTHEIYK